MKSDIILVVSIGRIRKKKEKSVRYQRNCTVKKKPKVNVSRRPQDSRLKVLDERTQKFFYCNHSNERKLAGVSWSEIFLEVEESQMRHRLFISLLRMYHVLIFRKFSSFSSKVNKILHACRKREIANYSTTRNSTFIQRCVFEYWTNLLAFLNRTTYFLCQILFIWNSEQICSIHQKHHHKQFITKTKQN